MYLSLKCDKVSDMITMKIQEDIQTWLLEMAVSDRLR